MYPHPNDSNYKYLKPTEVIGRIVLHEMISRTNKSFIVNCQRVGSYKAISDAPKSSSADMRRSLVKNLVSWLATSTSSTPRTNSRAKTPTTRDLGMKSQEQATKRQITIIVQDMDSILQVVWYTRKNREECSGKKEERRMIEESECIREISK